MKKLRFKDIAIAVIVLFIAIWSVPQGIVGYQAKRAYKTSRTHLAAKVGSYDFITMGINAKMDEKQVNDIMSGADDFMHMKQESPPWDGFVNIYTFTHGPKWWNPIMRQKETMVQERFYVYFDSGGRAVKIWWDLFSRSPFLFSSDKEIDLHARTISKHRLGVFQFKE